MNITIFGATGSVGIHLVDQALASGATVTAVVRNPSKITRNDERLKVVAADVLANDARLSEAVAGADAVMVALGDGISGRVRAVGTRNIIAAMNDQAVRRLVCQSTLGAGDSFDNLNWLWRFIFRVPLRKVMADHQRQERFVRESDLDWTIIRPAAFTDGEQTGKYRHGFDRRVRDLTLKISRADVADFMVRQIAGMDYLKMTPALSY